MGEEPCEKHRANLQAAPLVFPLGPCGWSDRPARPPRLAPLPLLSTLQPAWHVSMETKPWERGREKERGLNEC